MANLFGVVNPRLAFANNVAPPANESVQQYSKPGQQDNRPAVMHGHDSANGQGEGGDRPDHGPFGRFHHMVGMFLGGLRRTWPAPNVSSLSCPDRLWLGRFHEPSPSIAVFKAAR